MGVSGVPEVKNGVEIGFTDFSEFSVGAGLPSGLTAFGISSHSPTTVAVADDPGEGHYFSMDGHVTEGWGYGYDAFSGKMDTGEILVRIWCRFAAGLRKDVGGAASMSGLVGKPEASPDFDCWAGGIFFRSGIDVEVNGAYVDDGDATFPLTNVDLQEPFRNGAWCWVRLRRVPNSGTPANDDWTLTAWYDAFKDEPATPDGTVLNQTRVISGSAAVGWAVIPLGDVNEQRITYLAYSGDPTVEAPPVPSVLADLPDVVSPVTVGDLWGSGALKDVSPSGLIQLRSTKAAGWSWDQTWGSLSVRDLDHMALISFLERAWNRGEIFLVKHLLVPGSGLPPNGLGSSGISVEGAAQLGASLITDGWPVSTANVSRAGDVIMISEDLTVYLVTGSVASDSNGEAVLPITPPLRRSPSDGVTVTTTDAVFRVVMANRSRFEPSRGPLYHRGYAVTLSEALL